MDNVPLVIASGNKGKIGEFKKLLDDFPIDLLTQPVGFEIEETGSTFMENARIKAIAVSQATGNLSLADDSGLSVEALGGLQAFILLGMQVQISKELKNC